MCIDPQIGADERFDIVNEHLRLIQKKRGLTFGTDAYLLAAFVRPRSFGYAVELGGGSGIVSLLLAATGKVRRITSVEIQPDFADLVARNAAVNGLSDRVLSLCRDIRSLDAGSLPEVPSLVVANPPYLRADSGRSNDDPEKEIARHECFGGIGDFCACASRLLGTGGRFVSVWRSERLSELYAALRSNRLEPKRTVFVHSDVSSPPCMVLTEAVKDASPSLRVLPPLFLYEPAANGFRGVRMMTAEAQSIYNVCSFPEHGKYHP
ncbi:MAG: SAM-dependent methyltransferase [Clostridia bacterium]|nr:SAM-dependent methyltransferase [Clostridia bacterium]